MYGLRPFITEMPIKSGSVTVLLLKANGDILQTKAVSEKRQLVDIYEAGDRLIALWNGQWSTDAFELPLVELCMI